MVNGDEVVGLGLGLRFNYDFGGWCSWLWVVVTVAVVVAVVVLAGGFVFYFCFRQWWLAVASHECGFAKKVVGFKERERQKNGKYNVL